MNRTKIAAGSIVEIVDANGRTLSTRAVSGVETDGHLFPVVVVERPLQGGGVDIVPWPATAVKAMP